MPPHALSLFAWEQRKLDEVADVRDGTHDSPHYFQEGHPFVTSKNVKDGYINYNDIQYISDADFFEINKRSKVDINDILMGMIGTIGNTALVRRKPDFAIKNVALIKDTKAVYFLYLYHYLQSPIISQQLDESMDGGTQKFIALNKIRNLFISIPNKEEQFKVGGYIDKLDNLITLHQREPFLNIQIISPESERITISTSLFSSSWMICKYVFCVVVILECPSLRATLAIETPANNNSEA